MEQPNFFHSFLEKELNKQQKQAVIAKKGVMLVCAGAGSGKTRVITARIANLLNNHGVMSENIVALTFTNKAAQEMKERVRSFLPKDSRLPYVGTFHAYCLRLLKKYNHLLPFSDFSLLDSNDQKTLMKKVLADSNAPKHVKANNVLYAISLAKNAATNGKLNVQHVDDPDIRQYIQTYENKKNASHCFDFDDLLLTTLSLIKENNHIRQHLRSTIRHILVDEYQDTNLVQHALLTSITSDEEKNFLLESLCAVGDEDQSIYSWRGATTSNILEFQNDYPLAQLVIIEQNYRSVQPILETANHLIRHNDARRPKSLWSNKEGRDRLRIVQTYSSIQEGILAASLARHTQRTNQSCAILYRSHHQSRSIEEALIKQSIPYTIIGGIQFYERQEIKDLLAYLRLLNNPFDRVSFMRVYNTPTRGLGGQFEKIFFQIWDEQPLLSFTQVGYKILEENLLTGIRAQKLKVFLEVFQKLDASTTPMEALQKIITHVQYKTYLEKIHEKKEAQGRQENIQELLHAAQAMHEERGISTIPTFLDEVALLQELPHKKQQHTNSIKLMTLHAAKGLEFNSVMLTGLEEGIFPNNRSLYDPDALEEERRLLYVGITRAQEYVLITQARCRYMFGSMQEQSPSRFLHELPADHIQRDDAAHWYDMQLNSYIQRWFNNKPNEFAQFIPPHASSQPTTPKRQASPARSFDWDKKPFKTEPIWKKMQPVRHKNFGMGIIQKVEKRSSDQRMLTIRFSSGVVKKIDARFVQQV